MIRSSRSLTHLVVIAALPTIACKAQETERDDAPRARPSFEQLKADTPDWSGAFQASARFDAARSAMVVDVKVAPGFHAYTEGETIGKPLLLELAADSALKLSAPVEYPKGVAKDLPVGRSVIVEGSAEIAAPLADPRPGTRATGSLRYQVCTAEACDRPRTMALSVQVPGA